MDAKTFLGLEPTHNPFRFHMPVAPRVSSGNGALFGGSGLAAAVQALETATERPVVWATAQYLSYARVGSVLDLDVKIVISGRNTTQARVTGHVADQEIFTVNAALGSRDSEAEGQFAECPDAPPPGDCEPRPMTPGREGSITDRIEQRLVLGTNAEPLTGDEPIRPLTNGRAIVWARFSELNEVSAASLAVLGDWVPFGVSQTFRSPGGGNSLDNTLRVVQLVPTEWVLLDIQLQAVMNGFAHGHVHLWSEDKTLLGIASQSVIVRLRR